MRVGIVGGSLGGLTAALLLRDLGHDVDVLERSPVPLEQRGAGIGLMPETARYLVERAGVALNDISTTTDHIRHLDRNGVVTHDHLHTYYLSSWNTIYRQLLQAFGRDRYLLNHEVADLHQDDAQVDVYLGERGTESQHIDTYDLVVCADGVGSRFRRTFLPRSTPQYAGYVAWRGMVPEADLPADVTNALGDALTYFVYANSHILVYPIPGLDGSVDVGKRLINFVWYRNYLAGPDLDDVLTDVTGTRREVSLPPGAVRAEHVAEMKAHGLGRLPNVIAQVVAATDEPFLQVIFDVEVANMAFGRICLLGDAAWVVRPHAAAGTAKAADDAWMLEQALRAHPSVDMAMAHYERKQLAVGRQLLERTRRIGAQSQFDGTWRADDPEHLFGLHGPGQSSAL